MKTVTITLRNTGTMPADASMVMTTDPAIFTTGPAPGIIQPGRSATLDVHFHGGSEAAEHSAYLIIPACNFKTPLTARTVQEITIDLKSEQPVEIRMVLDDAGHWLEVGFLSPFQTLPGSAADGWTDPAGHILLRFERSEDLVNWDHNFIESPATPEPRGEDWMYWARSAVPRLWKHVTIDLTLTTNRHAKSITALQLFGTTISLPNYPYAMPAAASQLQTDLLAAGFAGATVSSVSGPLSVVVTNRINDDAQNFAVTLSGSNVTMVKNASNANISLPNYPYAIPSQISNLKADLLAAGFPYIGVRAYADEWTIFIPSRTTILSERRIEAVITPADSHTYQGMFGIGTDGGNLLIGTSGNVRATTGLAPLEEAGKQFARLGLSYGPNYPY